MELGQGTCLLNRANPESILVELLRQQGRDSENEGGVRWHFPALALAAAGEGEHGHGRDLALVSPSELLKRP